jgi:hypothetical protein
VNVARTVRRRVWISRVVVRACWSFRDRGCGARWYVTVSGVNAHGRAHARA